MAWSECHNHRWVLQEGGCGAKGTFTLATGQHVREKHTHTTHLLLPQHLEEEHGARVQGSRTWNRNVFKYAQVLGPCLINLEGNQLIFLLECTTWSGECRKLFYLLGVLEKRKSQGPLEPKAREEWAVEMGLSVHPGNRPTGDLWMLSGWWSLQHFSASYLGLGFCPAA